MSVTLQTKIVEIIIGFPSLSFTFKRSLSKLLALKEIAFFLYKGFAQYRPLSFMVPTYLPKSKITFDVFGFTKIKPKKPKKPMAEAKRKIGVSLIIDIVIPPKNKSKTTNNIK